MGAMSSSCCQHVDESDSADISRNKTSSLEKKRQELTESSSLLPVVPINTSSVSDSMSVQHNGYQLLYDACLIGDRKKIQRLAESCPSALCVKDNDGRTLLDICLKRYYSLLDNEEEDPDTTEMIVYLIRKSPNRILCPKLEYTLGSLGPIVSSNLLSSPNLKVLDLSEIHLTEAAMESLLEELSHNHNVLECSIPFLLVDRHMCEVLCNMLKQNVTLRRLTLRTRLLEKWRAGLIQSSLEASLVQNKTLTTLVLVLTPQYKLRLLDFTIDGDCDSQLDRKLIDMHLALNRAGPLRMDTITRSHLATMLALARCSLSAQFFLLQNAPHVLSDNELENR
mmetsp:Transcript_18555/g.28050  ORF Transcript_18555/g.28050 Transcript_18555/m.28050 type:complete len:338 (+) Transcript_18555:114-1127(+)